MQVEHGRLLKAFREAEGRDPDPNFDPEFWTAYAKILKARTGDDLRVESYDEYSNFQKRASGDGWVKPDEGNADLVDRMEKALDDGTAPAWLPGLLERSR